MKKVLIIPFLFLCFTSCKKDYSCTCITTVSGVVDKPVVYTYPNVTKTTARTKCFENSTTNSGPAYNKTTECTFN